MKKVNMLKKLLSFGLALALFVTSPASVYASQVEESTVEVASENKEEAAAETPATDSGEEKSESDIPSEDKDDSASLDNPAEGTEVNNDDAQSDDAVEDSKDEEAADEDSELSDEEKAEKERLEKERLEKEAKEKEEKEPLEISDAEGLVTLKGTKKSLGHIKSIEVTEITESADESEYKAMAEALNENTDSKTEIVDFVAYDIVLIDKNDDRNAEPDGEIKVVFNKVDVEGLNDSACETEVFHYTDSSLNEMGNVTETNDSVEMATTHLSKYIIAVTGTIGSDNYLYSNEYVNVSSKYYYYYVVSSGYNYEEWNNISTVPDVKFHKASSKWDNDYYYFNNDNNETISDATAMLKVRVFVDGNLNSTNLAYALNSDASYYLGGYHSTQYFEINVKKDDYYIDAVKSGLDKSDNPTKDFTTYEEEDGYYEIALDDYIENNKSNSGTKNVNYLDIYLESNTTTKNVMVDLIKYHFDAQIPTIEGANWTSFINYEAFLDALNNNKQSGYLEMNSGGQATTAGAAQFLNYYKQYIVNTNYNLTKFDTDANSIHYGKPKYGLADEKLDSTGMIHFSKYGTPNYFKTGNYDKTKTEYYKDVENVTYVNPYKYGYDKTDSAWAKEAHYNVAFPFTYKNGYYEFDSNKQTATFNENEEAVAVTNGESDFLPLGSDGHFGMHFTQYFEVPENGKDAKGNDYTFTFSGDDDVWVYIDGELVLDIGGIHDEISGEINFAKGISKVAGQEYKTNLNYKDGKAHEIQFYFLERGGNQSKCHIKFNYDVVDKPDDPVEYTKSITIEKTWEDNSNKSNSRPSEITFNVYGKYTLNNKTYYVTKGEPVEEVKSDDWKAPVYDTISLKGDEDFTNNENVWKKTVEGFPVFANGGTEDLITWELEEQPVAGYGITYSNTAVATNSEIKFEVEPPVAETSTRGTQYNHIDVELWTAKADGDTSKTIVGIQNFEGIENHISVYGWSPDYNGSGKTNTITRWNATAKHDLDVKKDTSTNEFSTRIADCNRTFSISDATKIAFRVRFDKEEEYQLVELDYDSVYPDETIVEAPTASEPLKNYKRICDQYFPAVNGRYPASIKLDGKRVFDISKASCGIGPSQGLDLLLTEKLLQTYTTKKDTGDVTYTITNTQIKSTVDTDVNKKAELLNWKDRTYTITLNAKAVETTEIPSTSAAVNVVIALDVSGSMNYPRSLTLFKKCKTDSLDTNEIYYYIQDDDVYAVKHFNSGWKYRRANDYLVNSNNSNAYANNWMNVSNGNRNYYTSDGITRLADTKDAACAFIDEIARRNPKSKIAIVKFSGTAATVAGLTELNEQNKESLKTQVRNLNAETTTNHYAALNEAYNLLDANLKDKNSIIIITDGLLYPDIAQWQKTEALNNSKAKASSIYAIGINFSYDTSMKNKAETLLKEIATEDENGQDLFKNIGDDESLTSILKDVSEEIGGTTSKGLASTVTDVIDPRFELIGEDGKPATTVVAEYYDDDKQKHTVTGTYDSKTRTITWAVPKTNDFKAIFIVKAKDDFFGGNVITTNGSFSGMTVSGQDPVPFEKPTVNVKLLDYELGDQETTVLKGDTIEGVSIANGDYEKALEYLKNIKCSYKDSKGNVHTVENVFNDDSLINSSSETDVQFTYTYPGTNLDRIGYINFKETSENAPNAGLTGDNVYSHKVTVKFVPDTYYNRITFKEEGIEEPTQTQKVEGSIEKTGTYKINVVDAGIYANKLGGATRAAINGAEYKLYDANNKVVDTFTSADITLNNKTEKGMYLIEGLGVGTYTLKETNAPDGYALSNETFTIKITKTDVASQYKMKITTDGNSDIADGGEYTFSVLGDANEDGTVDKGYFFDETEKKITSNETTYLYDSGIEKETTVIVKTKSLAAFSPVDQVLYVLPETGGRGVYVYTIGGVLLMLGACLLLYKNKKNKNK